MKKIIPLIFTANILTGCYPFSPDNLPTEAQLNPLAPTVAAVPVATEVALQISTNIFNGGLAINNGLVGSLSMAKLGSVFDGSIFKGGVVYPPHTVTEDTKEILGSLFQNEKKLSDSWVQTSPSVDFCKKITSRDEDYHGCAELIPHLSFQVRFTDQHSGKINGYFDAQKFVSLEFVPDGMSVDLTVSTIPTIFSTIQSSWGAHGVEVDLPTLTSASGTLKAMITKAHNFTHLSLTVTDEVNAIGSHKGSAVSAHLTTNSEVNFEYDQDLSLGTLDFKIGKIDFTDEFTLSVKKAITGKLIFDEVKVEVRAENLEISENGIDISNVQEPVKFGFGPITGTMKFYENGISISNDNYFSFFTNTVDGTISWAAIQGGTLTMRGFDQPWLRTGTDLSMFSSGAYGNGLFIVPAGRCFNMKPWQLVNCPLQ